MSTFVYFFLGLLVVITIIVLVVLHYVRKGLRFFKRMATGDLTEEEFKRMSDKHYSSKKQNSVHFDDDYFKGKGWQRSTGKQQQQQRRNRDPNAANKKIFAQDEGEYVDFKEV